MDFVESVGFIICLSIATESLVEIIKGILPWLNSERQALKEEGRRISLIRILAVFSGVFTAFLSSDVSPLFIQSLSYVVIGLIVSSCSSLWHRILSYAQESTKLKKTESTLAKSSMFDFSQAEEIIKSFEYNRLKSMRKLEHFNENIQTDIKELQKNLSQ